MSVPNYHNNIEPTEEVMMWKSLPIHNENVVAEAEVDYRQTWK